MKRRIWNQLKKAVMITAAVGILGAGAVSAAEFEAAEIYSCCGFKAECTVDR